MSADGVLARRRAEQRELLDAAERYVTGLERRFASRAAVVFGSVARGDFNFWSDIDLLLVLERIEGNPLERMAAVEPPPPRVQPVVWTRDEWAMQRLRGNQIVHDFIAHGAWLRGSASSL